MTLNRRQALAGLGAAAALAMPYVRPSYAAGGTLNIYNWSDYIGENTIAAFEKLRGTMAFEDEPASFEAA